MYQSVYYYTHQVQFSEIPVSDDDSFEPFFDKVEDSAKFLIEADEDWKLDLKFLISMNTYALVLCLSLMRWYKDKYINLSNTCSSKTIISNGQNDQNGEAKKAIQFAIQDDNEELIQFIKNFNKRKKAQLIQAESI
ncbi:6109_t:CDS:2, partial [Funneliformis caledonium]